MEPDLVLKLGADIPRGRLLPGTQIEIRNEALARAPLRSALFDFDGTVSLIREGWQQVMVPMMVEILQDTPGGRHQPAAQLHSIVREFVDRLTGKQTIYQMIQLADEVEKRGGTPLPPLEYKRHYLDRLWQRIESRVSGLKSGQIDPETMRVPGVYRLARQLRERGVTLYLASGTDVTYVQEEVGALGMAELFDGGVYGALDQYERFSKEMVIQDILRTHSLRGQELVAFGDGYVEIVNTKAVGGAAVGAATDEAHRSGVADEWKRRRLIEAGADVIVPDFREQDSLVRYLWGEDIT